MNREPHVRFSRFRAVYIFIFIFILVILLIAYWFIIQADRKVESSSYCLGRIECTTNFKEPMLGDFVKIPGGYFILPKDLTKTGYEIDSVYVNSFELALEKISYDTYRSVFCPYDNIQHNYSINNSVSRLSLSEIGFFVFRVNQLSEQHYRIPNDVEWMYAYQYLAEIQNSPKFPLKPRFNVPAIVSNLSQEPYEICSWEGRREKGDTISNFAFSEDLFSPKKGFITKGNIEFIYNRDVQATPCGIRLIRF
jgi:hypothetical protein